MTAYAVDWLSMAQQHPIGSVPDLGAGAFLVLDEDGAEERRTLRWVQSQGSHSSSFAVRCFNGLVEVSGNPSRFGRADNVFGLGWSDALEVVQRILHAFGLPRFSHAPITVSDRNRSVSRNEIGSVAGAVVRRVDLARNFETGLDAPGMRSFLEVLAQGNWQGRKGRMMDWSNSWGSRRYQYAKVYAKGPELRANTKAEKLVEERLDYRQRLVDWAEAVGLLRWEVQFGRDALRRHGCRYLGEIERRMGDLEREAEGMREKIWPTGFKTGLENVRHELEAQGVSSRQSAFLQALAHEWAAGVDVFSQFSRPTAYRYAHQLRSVGVDIRHPPVNVARLVARTRVVQVTPASIPDWYDRAA